MSTNNETKTQDNFIMLPTVDFCFKELMQNPKVRKGFVAALLHLNPEEIGETQLLPTMLRRDSVDDKLGILDVRVKLVDGTQMDLEMQILELKKLSGEMPQNDDVAAWMRFFSGKTREEFESMAKENEYIAEAYDTLLELSADEIKRLEYEAREKALKDYNTQVQSYWEDGKAEGIKVGKAEGIKVGKAEGIYDSIRLLAEELPISRIAELFHKSEKEILDIINSV